MFKKSAEVCMVKICQSVKFLDSDTQTIQCQHMNNKKERHYYHIVVENLLPNTKYYYQISLDEEKVFSGKKYFFVTGPNNGGKIDYGGKNPHFIIYGDDQTADFVPVLAQFTNHAQYNEKPDFMVHLGDINQNLWDLHSNNTFFTTKHKLFRTIPYMPVIGNHDAKPISQYDAFYNIEHWYSFEYGALLRFIIISSFDSLEPNTNGQIEFLEKELKESAEKNQFTIVCSHWDVIHVERAHEMEREAREITEFVAPLIEKYNKGLQKNVLWFNGHKHDYCRVIQNDMTYISIGACSNAKSYLKIKDDGNKYYQHNLAEIEYGKQSYVLLDLDVETRSLRLTVRKVFGGTIESLEFTLSSG